MSASTSGATTTRSTRDSLCTPYLVADYKTCGRAGGYLRTVVAPRASRRAAVGPGRGHRRPGEVPGHGPAAGPAVRTKGQLGIDVLEDAYGDGLAFDFVCGDEVYGSCTELRQFLEDRGQAYVLRVASCFVFALAPGTRMTCADAVKKLLKDKKGWEVRWPAGIEGRPLVRLGLDRHLLPRHSLLARRHLKTGELAFHYCFVPEGQRASKARLIRAAGLRWPVEESFELGKGCFGLDQCQARLYTAVLRHLVLVMAALAICAVTAAQLRDRTGAEAPPPARPDDKPPRTPGWSRCPSTRSSACSPPPSAAQSPPATLPAGSSGAAATRHDLAGSTNVHAWRATMPWSASDWILPY